MKNVVITGATSGIGNLSVKNFIQKGYKVFAGYRNVKLKQGLKEISENVIPFYIDMSKKWTISDAAKIILENLEEEEKIDILINAAGAVVAGAMECLNVDKIREQFEINTFSHLDLTQRLYEKLQGGRIINISSEASFGVFPFVAPYCASKRALDILFNLMEIECGVAVKVISIKPGVIKTPLWGKSIEGNKNVLGDDLKYEKEFNYLMKNAEKNKTKGLEPQKVADYILEISEMKNPKSSYTIGADAKLAEILSHLPQSMINKLVRKFLEKRARL